MPGAAFLYSTVWPVHMCILVYCLLRCPGAILGCGEREALDGLGKQGCLSLWVCTVLVSQEDHWTLNIEPKASRDITMKWRTGVLRHLHSHSKKKQCSVKPTLRESIQYIVLWREVTFWLMSGEWTSSGHIFWWKRCPRVYFELTLHFFFYCEETVIK